MDAFSRVKCQICPLYTLKAADRCPFIYTPSTVSGCCGFRRLGIATKRENSNRKFLKHQYADCMGFQWLDEAVMQKCPTNGGGCFFSNNLGCFQCEDVHYKL